MFINKLNTQNSKLKVTSRCGNSIPPREWNRFAHPGFTVFCFISFFFYLLLFTALSNIVFPKDVNAAFSAESQLTIEVQKMLDAGHLKPGYYSAGMLDLMMDGRAGEAMQDYFHNPADTIYTLAIAYPHLPSDMQSQVRTYLQQENTNYPIYTTTHVGWGAGSERMNSPWPNDFNLIPSNPQVADKTGVWEFWDFNPFNFYAAWKYAQIIGNAVGVFSAINDMYQAPPANAAFYGDAATDAAATHVLNIYIAGHIGYLELEQMATGQKSAAIQNTLNNLISLRLLLLDDIPPANLRGLEAGGFAYLVPELGEQMYINKKTRVQAYIDTYDDIMPYWFEAGSDEQVKDPLLGSFAAEGSNTPLYAVNSLFSARAYALKQSRSELEKYVDVPYFEVGDLFYIQKLVAIIESGPGGSTYTPTSVVNSGDANRDGYVDIDDYIFWIKQYLNYTPTPNEDPDFNDDQEVDGKDFIIWLNNYLN